MGGSHPGWNHGVRGIDHLTRRRTQGAGIVKGWERKKLRGMEREWNGMRGVEMLGEKKGGGGKIGKDKIKIEIDI